MPEMLVSGVRRSWLMLRSKLARSCSCLAAASIFWRSSLARSRSMDCRFKLVVSEETSSATTNMTASVTTSFGPVRNVPYGSVKK